MKKNWIGFGLSLCILLSFGCGDERHFVKGKKYFDSKMYQEANKEFEIVINKYPESEYLKRAKSLYEKSKAHIIAQKMYEEAQALDKQGSVEAAQAKYEETLIFMIQKDISNTEHLRKRIEELTKVKTDEHERLGDKYLNEKSYSQAFSEYDKAWEFSNRDPSSQIAQKRKTARRMIIIEALEQKIREAEERAKNAQKVPEKSQAGPKKQQQQQKEGIVIIRGPGARKGTQEKEESDVEYLKGLWKKLQADSLNSEEQQQLDGMVEQMNMLYPRR